MTASFRELADEVEVYTTLPSCTGGSQVEELRRLRQAAVWSDDAGCRGSLVYTDNSLLDPWVVAHAVLSCTANLAPLVAVQPLYTHPFAAAKMVATLGSFFNRRVDLNFVAGGFRFDLLALGDRLGHDDRYDRLAEFAEIMLRLLHSPEKVTSSGTYYSVAGLALQPPLPEAAEPRVTVSGSSAAGRRCAFKLGATSIMYPQPLERVNGGRPQIERADENQSIRLGMRIGVLARPTRRGAWAEAIARFPEDDEGKAIHDMLIATSDSEWHHRLSDAVSEGGDATGVYWLGPFRNYQRFCPYLVGSYDDVAEYLAGYLRAGIRCIILDEPEAADDLTHSATALQLALE